MFSYRTKSRPTDEQKERRAAIRAERARIRKQVRRAYLKRITANAPKQEG